MLEKEELSREDTCSDSVTLGRGILRLFYYYVNFYYQVSHFINLVLKE